MATPQQTMLGHTLGYKQVHGRTCLGLQVYLANYQHTRYQYSPQTGKWLDGDIGQLLQEDNAWFTAHPNDSARLRRYVVGEFTPNHHHAWVYVLVRRGVAGLVMREPAAVFPLKPGQQPTELWLANDEPERVMRQVGGLPHHPGRAGKTNKPKTHASASQEEEKEEGAEDV